MSSANLPAPEAVDSGASGEDVILDASTRSYIKKTNEIMSKILKENRYTLGDFLCTILKHSTHLEKPAQGSITQWLSGTTRAGTRPAEIVDAIYRHPHSLKYDNYVPKSAELKSLVLPERPSAARSDLAVSFLPQQLDSKASGKRDNRALYNSREGLEEWAARAMLFRANQEANQLETHLTDLGRPSWDSLREFSPKGEREKMKQHAPLLWATFSLVALNKRRLARRNRGSANVEEVSGTDTDSDSSSGSEDDDDDDDESGIIAAMPAERRRAEIVKKRAKRRVDKAATWATFFLIGHRNRRVGSFKTYLGVFYFASNMHKDVFRTLSCIGMSPAYNTVREHLKTLAGWAQERLKQIGRSAYESTLDNAEKIELFWFNFDNINKYVLPRNETVGNKAKMRNGTAATVIMLEDVPKGAFDRKPYIRNVEAARRRELTVDALYQDIDHKHLANAGTGMIMRILAKNIPGLKPLRHGIEQLFKDPGFCAVHRLRLRKSRIYPLGTSAINEATVDGASDVIDDLVDQMGMEPDWFDNLLVPVGGDQLSVDRTQRAIGYLDQEESIRNQKSWVLPLIQPWHMGWAYMKAVMRTHWYEHTGKDTLGLRRSIGMLGRQLNSEDGEFYPTFDALSVVFKTMILSAARGHLNEAHADIPPPLTNGKQLQLLEELEWYFSEAGPMHDCSIDDLMAFARRLYDQYLTTEGFQAALAGPAPEQPSSDDIESILMHNMEKQLLLRLGNPSLGHSARSQRRNIPTVTQDRESLLAGDQVLGNGGVFMRDTFYLLEFFDAMEEGDPGRMMRIMDVFRFAFWGSNSSNYGFELLEMACNFKFEYPDALKEAILNNYLVNPSGLPKHWQAGNLLQEHYNKDIKNIFNSKSLDFDSPFMRESISLNIAGFSEIKESADINVLGVHFSAEKFFNFTSKRSQPYKSNDMLALGYTKLKGGALATFLNRTLNDRTAVHDEPEENGGEEDARGPEPAPQAAPGHPDLVG